MEKLCLLPLPISIGHSHLAQSAPTLILLMLYQISENSEPISSQIPYSRTQ